MDRTTGEPRGGVYKRLRSQLLEEWFAWISEKNARVDILEAEVGVARGEWEGVRGWADTQNLWVRVGQDGGWIARELELRTALERKEAEWEREVKKVDEEITLHHNLFSLTCPMPLV